MFFDEARLAARLNHPNVVQTYEVVRERDECSMIMEYLDGQPLHRILAAAQSEPAPPGLLLQIVADALAGLHHAHELRDYDGAPFNIVHRDISPHNIVVTYQGQTKVVDFGIVQAEGRITVTKTGAVKGKFKYMAPEQLRGETVDRRADVFIVGLVLWEVVVGSRTWARHSERELLACLQLGEVPDLAAYRPDVDPRVAAICRKALAPEPGDRHGTAAEMRAEILAYLDSVNQRASAEQIGAYVARCFAAQRARITKIIEEQLRGWTARGGWPSCPCGGRSRSRRSNAPSSRPSRRSAQRRRAPSLERGGSTPAHRRRRRRRAQRFARTRASSACSRASARWPRATP